MKYPLQSCLTPLVVFAFFFAIDAASGTANAARPGKKISARPTVAPSAGEQLDSLFTIIADGGDSERRMAIDTLHELLHSGGEQVREIAKDYAYDIRPPEFTPTPNQKRCALLVRAIPRMIAEVDDRPDCGAYAILIFIQPYFPPADRALWEKWWREKARAQFEAMAGEG